MIFVVKKKLYDVSFFVFYKKKKKKSGYYMIRTIQRIAAKSETFEGCLKEIKRRIKIVKKYNKKHVYSIE